MQAYIDAEHLNKNEYINNHNSRWILRALFVIAASNDILNVLGMTLIFIALFDGILNKFRGLDLMYLGQVAKWDLFFTNKLS